MRQRNWNLITLSGMIVSITLGIIYHLDVAIIALGFGFGGIVILIIHNTYGSDRDYDKETARLTKEGKYRKTIKCSNCGTIHSFTPSHGVCMLEFLQDEKCTNCKCSLKETKQRNDEVVN